MYHIIDAYSYGLSHDHDGLFQIVRVHLKFEEHFDKTLQEVGYV